MELKTTKTKRIQVVTNVICDCCGKDCTKSFMTMNTRWGYESKKDMEEWTAHICEDCIDEKFSFVKFNKEDYFISS